ncbi:ClpX C4-type zinc finger protein [Kribbella sp. NPDC058245]|uniref:ClpX C4-type zinc finger protein n=1 Tax=Kribbella sp. NPDC058245 TaxID=3346399 RepID=UPI0036E3070F
MPETAMRCSFCAKDKSEVERLIAGPGVFICNECVGLSAEILSGRPTSSFPPLDGKTDDELLADVARLNLSRGQVETAVRDRVQHLRSRSVTWARIGEALNMSRQSAWERFSGEE